MIIKADEGGMKAITDLADAYLKLHGIKGMNMVQAVSQGVRPFTNEELEAMTPKASVNVPNQTTSEGNPTLKVKK